MFVEKKFLIISTSRLADPRDPSLRGIWPFGVAGDDVLK